MSPGATDDFMAPLRAKYLVQLRERRPEFTGFLDVLGQGPLAEDTHADMRKKTHRLAGSAATYGFPWISSAARALELALDAQMDVKRLTELSQTLLREVDRALGSRGTE